MKIIPREKGETRWEERKIFVSPFLAWSDFSRALAFPSLYYSLRSQKILLNISNLCQNNSSCLVGPVSYVFNDDHNYVTDLVCGEVH